MLSKIPSWLKNKYGISLLIFFLFLALFDQNNLITQYSYRSKLNSLKTEKEYFVKEIQHTRKELNQLTENPKSLEKFARENYFMKKNDEVIFVFTTK